MKKWKSYEWRGKDTNRNQFSLLVRLNLALPYTPPPTSPALSVSFIKICDSVGHGGCREKKEKAFLAAREAWNHLVRVRITQMNKLWVGILISGKHLSLERENVRAAADSFSLSLSPSSVLHHTSTSALFVFAPFFSLWLPSHMAW